MSRMLKIVLPIVVVAVGAAGAAIMIMSRPVVQRRPPEVLPPLVRTFPVATEDLHLSVHAQGTVAPRVESALVSEVSGRVLSLSPSLVAGGFFEAGEVLLTIDARDYELAVIQARGNLAQAELRLAQEQEEAEVARSEWKNLGRGEPSALALREPQLAEARAALEAARAHLEQAERNLKKTRVTAPYRGRVREKQVDVGQFVGAGAPLARIYAVDAAEVRLPLPDADLAYLDLPRGDRGASSEASGPPVVLRAIFAGERHEWHGHIVRTEGEIDPRSRMVHVVARVQDPYGRGAGPDHPPLKVGLFVEAEITGKKVENVIVLPRAALREDGRVLVVDDEDRLRFREIEVLQTERDRVIVTAGLEPDERICLSPLATVVDGMKVRTFGETS